MSKTVVQIWACALAAMLSTNLLRENYREKITFTIRTLFEKHSGSNSCPTKKELEVNNGFLIENYSQQDTKCCTYKAQNFVIV